MPKSGTTYLQEKLWRNRHTLREAGVHYPGSTKNSHFFGVLDLRETDWLGRRDPAAEGAWQRLVDQARQGFPTTIISHELFAMADADEVERVLADLSFAEVHVVCTARDLARQVPAMWQENIKNRGTQPYARFVRRVRDATPEGRQRWRRGPADGLRAWARRVPPERVHVVTVPSPGATGNPLWTRFAETVGIDPALELSEPAVTNPSMGMAETDLIRRLNPVVADVSVSTYGPLVKHDLAVNVLARRADTTKVVLPPRDRDWVLRMSEQTVAELRDAGYRVVGDLDELIPDFATAPARPRHPDDTTDAESVRAAAAALASLTSRVRDRRLPRRISNAVAKDAVAETMVGLAERVESARAAGELTDGALRDALVDAIAWLLRRLDQAPASQETPTPVPVSRSVPRDMRGTLRDAAERHPQLARLLDRYRGVRAGWDKAVTAVTSSEPYRRYRAAAQRQLTR